MENCSYTLFAAKADKYQPVQTADKAVYMGLCGGAFVEGEPAAHLVTEPEFAKHALSSYAQAALGLVDVRQKANGVFEVLYNVEDNEDTAAAGLVLAQLRDGSVEVRRLIKVNGSVTSDYRVANTRSREGYHRWLKGQYLWKAIHKTPIVFQIAAFRPLVEVYLTTMELANAGDVEGARKQAVFNRQSAAELRIANRKAFQESQPRQEIVEVDEAGEPVEAPAVNLRVQITGTKKVFDLAIITADLDIYLRSPQYKRAHRVPFRALDDTQKAYIASLIKQGHTLDEIPAGY